MGIAISAGLDLGASIGELNTAIRHLSDQLALERSGKHGETNPVISPIFKKLFAAKATPASALTYTFIDCNPYGVPKGYIWDLRRLTISGPDPFTSVTGNVFPFIGNVPADSNTEPANFPDLIDVATTTIPNLSFWSSGSVILTPGEHLVVCLKSLPNSQQINISYQITEFIESDLSVKVTR
jgi:hypothetical protein